MNRLNNLKLTNQEYTMINCISHSANITEETCIQFMLNYCLQYNYDDFSKYCDECAKIIRNKFYCEKAIGAERGKK